MPTLGPLFFFPQDSLSSQFLSKFLTNCIRETIKVAIHDHVPAFLGSFLGEEE
jgi:hypothetical protein